MGFAVEIEGLTDVDEAVGVEDESGHQPHVFVDVAFEEGEAVAAPVVGADDDLPGAHAVADEAGFIVFVGFVDGGEIANFLVFLVEFVGAEHDEVGFVFFVGFVDFVENEFDGGLGDVIVRVDEPKIVALGLFRAEVFGGSGAGGLAS